MPHFAERRKILYANLSLVSGYALIMYAYAQPLGTLIYMVAAVGTISQLVMDEKWGRVGMYLRIAVAAILVLCGASLLYSAPTDLIAIVAFALARTAETQTQPQKMRICFFMSFVLFVLFAGISGVWPIFFVQIALTLSVLVSIGRHSGHIKIGGLKFKTDNSAL